MHSSPTDKNTIAEDLHINSSTRNPRVVQAPSAKSGDSVSFCEPSSCSRSSCSSSCSPSSSIFSSSSMSGKETINVEGVCGTSGGLNLNVSTPYSHHRSSRTYWLKVHDRGVELAWCGGARLCHGFGLSLSLVTVDEAMSTLSREGGELVNVKGVFGVGLNSEGSWSWNRMAFELTGWKFPLGLAGSE